MDFFNFVQADVIAASVVELGGAGGSMIGHGCRVLQRATIFQVGGDPRRPKAVVGLQLLTPTPN